MKILKLIFSFFILFCFIQPEPAISIECKPCGINCTWQSPYNPPYSYGPENERHVTSGLTYGNSTCYFEVRFKMSECYCPNLKRELFIESIEFFGGGDCDNIPKDMIVSRAIQQLLYESSVIFDIDNPGNPFDITIKVPSCLKKSYTRIYLDDCNNDCCETIYTLQHTDNQGQPPNSVVVLDKSINDPEANCPGLTQNQCQNICESNDVPLGPLFPDYEFSCPSGDPCEEGWDTRPKVQSFTIGNCTFAAYFYTRDNCYYYNLQRYLKEIKIQKIVLVTPGCSPLPSNETILNTAWKKILYNPGRWFNNDECILIHTRVYECWVNLNSRLLMPCNQYACCSHSYWVSRTGNNPDYEYRTELVTCLEDEDEPNADPDENTEICENSCSNLCEASFVGYNILLRGVDISHKDFREGFDLYDVQINTIHSKNILVISIFSYLKTNFELSIIDLLGNQIQFFRGQNQAGNTEINLDLASLLSGVYFYNIKFIDKEHFIKAGKFIIIK